MSGTRASEAKRTLAAARAGDERAFGTLIEPYRRELRAHCYRMGGSLHDADDLLQESLVKAWSGLRGFEGRSGLRTWLYRVSTNACIDALEKKSSRTLPTFLGEAAEPDAPVPPPRLEPVWLEPCPDSLFEDSAPSPEARYSTKESVALAFLAALQTLPPRQRAILIARDVLGFSAEECAELFETSVESVNSALVRARESIEGRESKRRRRSSSPSDDALRTLLARYVNAWEKADPKALVSLLHEEATLSMPPLPIWLSGPKAIGASIAAMVLTPDARGAFRFLRTRANGLPALAAYAKNAAGVFEPSALHVLEVTDDGIVGITAFLDPSLFPRFELPASV